MKKIFILIILCLSITKCKSYYDLSKHPDAIIKYKNVDSSANWIELGIKENRKAYIIYVSLEADSIYNVNDTLK